MLHQFFRFSITKHLILTNGYIFVVAVKFKPNKIIDQPILFFPMKYSILLKMFISLRLIIDHLSYEKLIQYTIKSHHKFN